MLVEESRLCLTVEVGSWIDTALSAPRIVLLPVEPALAVESVRLPGQFPADPADRLIVVTARHWSVPVVTAGRATLDYAASGHGR